MNITVSQYELLIQRCVDGELEELQQVELIQQLDQANDSESWRALAIQFMEQQVLKDLFADQNSNTFAPRVQSLPTAPLQSPAKPNNHRLRFAATVALGLFLGLSLSLLLEGQFFPSGVNQADTQLAQERGGLNQINIPDAPGKSPQSLGNASVLVKQNSTGIPKRTAPSFEVYEYPTAEMFYEEDRIPDHLRQKLEDLGYVIERRSRAFRLPLENGQEVMVPSDTIHIRSAGR